MVPAGGKATVKTGWAIAIPPGTFARIAPLSGLVVKTMIQVGAGVIDSDYREVCVALFNHSNENLEIERGMRVAQLILERFDATGRSTAGFRSTGMASPAEK